MKIKVIYFSSTKSTEKIVKTCAGSIINSEIEFVDVTKLTERDTVLDIANDDLLIIGTPVYSGFAPKGFVEYLQKLAHSKAKAVVIATYGNRSSGQTCRQISQLLSDKGLKTIAAADFIAEHSFSNHNYPIAAGRPDAEDFCAVEHFGALISNLLTQEIAELNLGELEKVYESPELLFTPPSVTDDCINCGKCIDVCPENMTTKVGACIGCCACVKVCPQQARIVPDKILEYQKKLNQNCRLRNSPKLYLP